MKSTRFSSLSAQVFICRFPHEPPRKQSHSPGRFLFPLPASDSRFSTDFNAVLKGPPGAERTAATRTHAELSEQQPTSRHATLGSQLGRHRVLGSPSSDRPTRPAQPPSNPPQPTWQKQRRSADPGDPRGTAGSRRAAKPNARSNAPPDAISAPPPRAGGAAHGAAHRSAPLRSAPFRRTQRGHCALLSHPQPARRAD